MSKIPGLILHDLLHIFVTVEDDVDLGWRCILTSFNNNRIDEEEQLSIR